MISTMCFPDRQGKFVKNLSVSHEWVEVTAARGSLRTLLYVTFCIHLVGEKLFLSENIHGILKSDA